MSYLKRKTIRTNLGILTILWIESVFNYYLIAFEVKYFPGDINKNQLASLLAEAIGIMISGYLLTRVRGKYLFAASSFLAGATGLFMMSSTVKEAGSYFVLLVLIAKFGLISGFNVIYIFHPKMFPTLFSMTSMGIMNIISRLFTIFAPFVAEMDEPIPMLTFTTLCFIAGTSALFLIEPEVAAEK